MADRTEKAPTPARRLPWFLRSVSSFSASLSPCDDPTSASCWGGLPVGWVLRGEGLLLGGENKAGVAEGEIPRGCPLSEAQRDCAQLPPQTILGTFAVIRRGRGRRGASQFFRAWPNKSPSVHPATVAFLPCGRICIGNESGGILITSHMYLPGYEVLHVSQSPVLSPLHFQTLNKPRGSVFYCVSLS